jgi:quinol monooxygenase YgiN
METTDIEKFRKRTKDSVRLLAFFHAKPGKIKELEKMLLALVPLTRSEPGNIAYVLHRMDDDPNVLMFDEIWASREAIDEHAEKPYIKNMFANVGALVIEPPRIEIYSEL